MGSRGGGGNIGSVANTFAVSDSDGNEMGLIIELRNKEVYWQNSRGDINQLPSNVTATDYVNRVVNNGGTVQRLTKADLDKRDAAHQAYRKAMDAFLNSAYVNDSTMKRGSRADRNSNRANRRTRRAK